MTGPGNPFRVGERVRGVHFTDRATELRVTLRALQDRGRLLLLGPRRMGKSTVIGVAAERVRKKGGLVLEVDLATVMSLAEAAERLLAAVSRQDAWRDRLVSWVSALSPSVTLSGDATGRPQLGLSLELRPRREANERELLERVLDRIDATAAEHEGPVAVVLDEFQRLSELGGEAAEWLLRNRMQEHRHTAYVCAGSDETLIGEMLQVRRAFYGFFEQLCVGPIATEHLAGWLEDRLNGAGVSARGLGAQIAAAAGPRTQDIMLLARMVWFRCSAKGRAEERDMREAMSEIVTGAEAALRRTWEGLTTSQQRLLRAIAAGAEQLHATETRERYSLGPSSSVTTMTEALVKQGILGREGAGLRFDDPFFRAWIQREVPAQA